MGNIKKLVGVVNWFYDKNRSVESRRNANYGFIKHPVIGDLYFNERLVDPKTSLKDLSTDTVVTFYSRESSNKKGAYEAYDVCLVEFENDIEFCITEFLNSFSIQGSVEIAKIKATIKKKIRTHFDSLTPIVLIEELLTFEKLIADRIIGKDLSLEWKDITEIVSFIQSYDEALAIKIEREILENADRGTVFNLWIDGRVSYCDVNYINEIFGTLDFDIQEKAIKKLESLQGKQVLLNQIYLLNTNQSNIVSLVKLIDKCDEDVCPELMHALLTEKNSYFSKEFWISDFGITNIIFSHSEKNEQVRNALLLCNQHYIQKELNDELFLDVQSLKKLYHFIESNLSENITLLKEVFAEKVNSEIAHELWLIDILDNCQISYISEILLGISEKNKELIFSKCTVEEKSNILFSAIFKMDLANGNFEYSSLKELLTTTNLFAPDVENKILSEVLNTIPEYYKLNLWLDEFYDELDFNLYKPYVITLSTDEQRLFLKKVLKYIHEGRVSLELDDLTSLSVMDYGTSIAARQIDGSKIDFSTSIVLNTLKELRDNDTFQEATIRSKILEVIINQIKSSEDLLEIKGFFDECAGRCRVQKNEKTNNNGEKYIELSLERSTFDKPKMHVFCDGRKSMQIDNITPNLHEDTKKEFWWCANSPCHDISRKLHSSEDWRNYSLMDFLHVLKIDYNEIDLELYLNVINKLNRYLSHMHCRACNEILRPIKKAEYAFDGVTMFFCQKEGCHEKGKQIYINYCNNGKCGDIVDSRDSVKCSPDGFSSEHCGWYICKNCHACCTTSGIAQRSNNMKVNGRKYVCHTEGHKDLGIMFCNQCGSKMNNSEGDPEKRKTVIEFFRHYSSNPQVVASSGQRPRDGGWWFRFAKGQLTDEQYQQKLRNLSIYGFNIPNIEDKSLTVQFVSEPYSNEKEEKIIICSNSQCVKTVSLSDNLERARAITAFHSKIFPKSRVERF